MKFTFHHILLACALNLMATVAFSSSTATNCPSDALYGVGASYSEIPSLAADAKFRTAVVKPTESATDPKDSTALSAKPSTPRTAKVTAEGSKTTSKQEAETPVKDEDQEDDSILSFNFLYYIFQKYKLQDIVD